jgi:transcriptional regulator with XRE-family HTH domain
VELSEVIRQRRTELGMSQAELANAAGLDKRQIRRYEAGDAQPLLPVAVELANALKISLVELAGMPTHRINLNGDWWAGWQTSKDLDEVVTAQEVRVTQQGELLTLHTTTRGIAVEEGGYHWHGELRLWDSQVLLGWYAADDGSIRSKGTMYFVLHPHGQLMHGRWVGLSHDGKIMTGWGTMGKSEAAVREAIDDLKAHDGLADLEPV